MSSNTSSSNQNVIIAQPLEPNAQSYQVMNNTDLGKGQLFALDPATGEYTAVGNASGFSYNALAYDTNTDFLYAIAAGSGSDVNGEAVVKGTFIKIDKNGNTFAISDIEGGAMGGMIMADVVNGAMIVGNSKTKTFYSIDVSTGEATELTRTDSTGLANDLAAVGDTLYGVSNNNLRAVKIEGDTVSVTSVKLTGGPDKFPAGAIWAATNENGESELYAFDNKTGDIYRIDDFTGDAPNAVKVSTGFSPSNSNDGARNPEAAFEVPVSAPAEPKPTDEVAYSEGVFTTGADGNMTIDFMYDGGGFQSEIAVFSLEGMTATPGTEAFVQEAAKRALTNEEGYVLIKDSSEGAKTNFKVDWEQNFAHGEYKGPKSFYFDPGTQFAVMLVQNTSVQKLADDPSLSTEFGKQAIFSLPEANAGGVEQGRLADFNGLSTTGKGLYGMEDIAIEGAEGYEKADHDYNDIVFQIMGATAEVASAADVTNENRPFSDVAQEIIDYSKRDSFFSGGTFTVGGQSAVHIDYLFDGGAFESELGIFSLEGMEQYVPGSNAFIKEATRRALSDSPQGYRVIKDNSEGARFSSDLMDRERNLNDGFYKGEKSFAMTPGSEFAVLLVQHTSIREIYNDPTLAQEDDKRVIFSITEANPGNAKGGQIVDINGAGKKGWGTYAIEDQVVGVDGADRDYNDVVFQVRGAAAQGVEAASDVIRPTEDWLGTPVAREILDYARPFKEGSFLTDDNGLITFDYLFDGGGYRGELAIFSLEGMEAYTPGSEAFIQEAARRAASDSKQGRILMADRNEGARFEGEVGWESNFNGESYRGIKTFELNANEQFAVMSVRRASVAQIAEDPTLASQEANQILFSIPEANGDGTLPGQIVDMNGRGKEGFGLYAMEDLSLEGEGADRDYNDIVFQLGGAVGDIIPVSERINVARDFASTEIGQEVLNYSNRENFYTEGTFIVGESAEVNVDFLFDGGGFNKGELGIFNLRGMEKYALDSAEFLQEAANRALSGSELGHVVIQDRKQSARFQTELEWERDFNGGVHVGEQTYTMNAGDQFALILSQNTSIADLANNPALASQFGKKALFSIPEANPGTNRASQIVDLNGLGSVGSGVYGMEDLQVGVGGSDRDFNDIVFQIKGAVSVVTSADGEIREDRDWRELTLGQDLLNFSATDFDQHLQGDKGRDQLIGSIGTDLIEGFRGRDILDGGLGDDLLTGGNGEDTFVLRTNAGTDTITDFKQNYDVLGISDGITFNDLAFAGNDILLKGSNEILATLSGFDTTRLSATDFVGI